ncbi:MAG: ATP-dependent RecD-like DNA helicase [Firmicutes bacterium]|nr:ATP-dependent RecD-like DNA helicase [Bacillota bacterium]
MVDLQGQIERVTYHNEENNYAVVRLKVSGRQTLVTVTGNIINPTPGEVVQLRGEWVNHPKYGEQFKAVYCNSIMPASLTGIEKYLGSGLIKGIGPVMAKRIVKKFKTDTLDIIENDIERLQEVEGIGQVRIKMIKQAWEEQKEIRSVMMFLQAHGVSVAYASKIYKQYQDRAIEVVTQNPYQLARDIFGIGFITADKIAEKLGFAKDSDVRVEAGILYVLHQLAEDGHVCYPLSQLIDECVKVLEVDRELVTRSLTKTRAEGQVIVEELSLEDKMLYGLEENSLVYLAQYHVCETSIAARLAMFAQQKDFLPEIDCSSAVEWVEKQLAIKLAPKQKEAIEQAVTNKVMVITGGPGTGKTTIINAILKVLAAKRLKVLLAAPTGRAAKRMNEATGHEAKTIHRLLEYSMQKGGFQRDDRNPLKCDFLIIDEASMIDTILMHHLLKAVPLHAHIVFVGDVNQLPSVGAGSVFNDIIQSGVIPVVELNEIFRQAKQSTIVVNAHRINSGEFPYLRPTSNSLNDFYFIEKEDPNEALQTILYLVNERIPKRFGFNPIDDVQVLTPMHRGVIGAGNLNLELQNALNHQKEYVARGGITFKKGDKVMQIRNNYDKDVFNGDIGRIVRIDSEEQEVTINFDGRYVNYDYSNLDEVVLAYAISVHKSQGSEYPVVVIPVLTQHFIMLQRNLIYTGVTRGKKLVIIVGTKKAMAIAVKNNKTQKRYTLLNARLQKRITK